MTLNRTVRDILDTAHVWLSDTYKDFKTDNKKGDIREEVDVA